MLTNKEALTIAKLKLSRDIHCSECGANKGIRAIYEDEAEWLSVLIRMAEQTPLTADINSEVARQIFAELESVATINTHTSDIKISACNYAEVKNKYTKEGVGE